MALGDSLQQSGGLWFGWSGTIVEERPDRRRRAAQPAGRQGHARHHRPEPQDHDSYYLGYSNDVLWPVFHNRLDLAHFDAGFIGGYRRVNQLFARKLMPLLKDDDIIWVHDYHLIPLAAELRAMGCRAAHRLLPAHPAAAADHHRGDSAARMADALAVRLRPDRLPGPAGRAALRALRAERGARANCSATHLYRAYGQTVRCNAFPIGIDVDEFAALTHAKESRDMYETHEARVFEPPACCWASTGSTTPRASRSACARSASCWPTTPRTGAARR